MRGVYLSERILTARGARALVDWCDGRFGGGGFFRVADDADNVLPPVDVVRECGLTQLTGVVAVRVDVDEHLKNRIEINGKPKKKHLTK